MRRKPVRKAIGIATAVVLVVGLAALAWPREPTYRGRSLTYWVGRQASGSFKDRVDARQALVQMGPEAVPALTRLLTLRAHGIGHTLRNHLSTWIPRCFSAPPDVVAVRKEAITLLGGLGPSAASAAPALLECLDAADPIERQLLERTLASLGEPASGLLVAGLRQSSLTVRTSVARAISLSGGAMDVGHALPALLELGRSEDAEARQAAAAALAVLALRHHSAVAREAVLRLAQDPDPLVALGILMASLTVSVPGTADDDQSSIENLWLPAAPGFPPSEHPAGLGILEVLMKHPSAEIRAMAAGRHWQLARAAAVVLPVLTEAMEEPNVIWLAGAALRAMGPAAEPAIPALLEAVVREPVHRPDRTPATSAMALAAIGPPALPGLLKLLDHEHLDVRLSAANAIRVLGPAASEAVPGLLRLLEQPSAEAKTLACDTLGAIGPAAAAALPDLEKLEATSRGYPQAAAAEAMQRIRREPPQPMNPEPGSPLPAAG